MDNAATEAQGPSLDPESEGLTLPTGMVLEEKLGTGRMCTVYRATFMGESVALKAYHPEAVTWYKNRHGLNIAVHEMAQNRAFRQVPELLPYTAKPIRVIGQDGSVSLCFLQELVKGIPVEELGRQVDRMPEGLLETGRRITRICDDRGLSGIDQFLHSTRVREHAGQWTPIIHDFKHVPAQDAKTESKPSLLSRIGLGGKKNKDPAFVQHWASLAGKGKT